MTIADDNITSAARRLVDAARSGRACRPVRDIIGTSDVEAAYAVQRRVNGERVAEGAVVVGRKIGLTSKAVQQQLGVDRPDFGVLFSDMQFVSGDTLPMDRLIQPRVEAEVAFILREDLIDGDLDSSQVRSAVGHVAPALEIVDSRIDNWNISFGDTVADNGSSGLYVLGSERITLDEVEPAMCEMTMSEDGQEVSQGTGRDCLGDPLAALSWLAVTSRELGMPLRSGEVVLSGALGPMVPAKVGAMYEAKITGLGSVSCRFG